VKNSNQYLGALVLALALALTGCGGDEATPTPTTAPSTQSTNATEATNTPVSKVAIPAVSAGGASSPLNSPLNSPLASGGPVPTQRGVWNTTVGTDNMTGDCKASVLPAYGLVQITPQGSTIEWKNQEPQPYTMQQIAPTQFQYAGPTVSKDGTVTMTVTFVDDKNLTMIRDFVATDAPACTHHHEYAGVFQWNK